MSISLRFALLLGSGLLSLQLAAGNQGRLDSSRQLNASAQICFTVGLTASLTGLDDLVLQSNGASGAAGTRYQGQDQFLLESNGQVQVVVQNGTLKQGAFTLTPAYRLDGKAEALISDPEAQQQTHTLDAEVLLASISGQLTGDYQGVVTLLVLPYQNSDGSCGDYQVSYPGTINGSGTEAQWATLAFEDLYPNPGDADYNDMVVKFQVQEQYNQYDQLETIQLNFEPAARGAGYNHSLWLSLDGELDSSRNITAVTEPAFYGGALVEVTYQNLNSGSSHTRSFEASEDIPLLHNTRSSLAGFANVYPGQEETEARFATQVDIQLFEPELNQQQSDLLARDLRYRPFLYVMNTRQHIDLYPINPDDGMIDANGYPFGLIVPDDWRWPAERVNINDAYPYFGDYRQWLTGETTVLSSEAEQWYLYPADDPNNRLFWQSP